MKDIIQSKTSTTIHVIILVETWLYQNETDLFHIPSYTAVHDCRDSRGGGTSIYIKDDIDYNCNDITFEDLNDCNLVSVHLTKEDITILGIYRPPSNDMANFLSKFDKILEMQKKTLCDSRRLKYGHN